MTEGDNTTSAQTQAAVQQSNLAAKEEYEVEKRVQREIYVLAEEKSQKEEKDEIQKLEKKIETTS